MMTTNAEKEKTADALTVQGNKQYAAMAKYVTLQEDANAKMAQHYAQMAHAGRHANSHHAMESTAASSEKDAHAQAEAAAQTGYVKTAKKQLTRAKTLLST